MKLTNRVRNHFDVGGSTATAPADEAGARLNDSSRVLSHVLRRAHVNLSAANIARQSGIGLRRQSSIGKRAHLLDRVQNDRRPHTTVESNYICAPLSQARREYFRR